MWAVAPLLILPIAVYNAIVAFWLERRLHGDAQALMNKPLFTVSMASHAAWPVSLGDLLVFGALVILFVELLKSTTSRHIAIINHSLSMILFIGCLVEFLLFPAFATSAFFLVTCMVLLDVLAGFIVTIAASRREIDVR